MINTQIDRILVGNRQGYPDLEVTDQEMPSEMLLCKQSVRALSEECLQGQPSGKNGLLFTRLVLLLGRTFRLKMQHPSEDSLYQWRQVKALLYAHYDLWIPDPIEESPEEEDEETLSLHADSDEQWEELLTIECQNTTAQETQPPEVSTNATEHEAPLGRHQRGDTTHGGTTAPPRAPGPVTWDGDECRRCWTKGHHRKECPYRRYHAKKEETRQRNLNLQREYELGSTTEGSGGPQGLPLSPGQYGK